MRQCLNYIFTKITVTILLAGIAEQAFAQPVAAFSGAPLAGCSPLVVNFQDLSTGTPTSWNWNFGNGNTSTLQNPTATYFNPGTYNVTLTVTNAGGSNAITKNQYITVYEPPVVNFNASVLSGCFPLRVQFTDQSTGGTGNINTTWDWDFGDGNISNLQNPLHTYTSAGSYTVTLKVTNDKGCTKTVSRAAYINVTPGVTGAFTNTQASVCAAPATIGFTNNTSGPPVLSYIWDFGDGSPQSSVTSPSHTYLTSGTYIAMLVANSSAGCVDTVYSAPITIGGITTDFNFPAAVCVNESASFTNASTPVPASASWVFGDGGTATTINAAHAYAAAGTYTVKLYNSYANCIDSASHTITVNPRPTANFSAPITSQCKPPFTVNFQDLSSGGVTGWQWDFGDGGTSTLQNPSHTYTNYGVFDVTLIVTSNAGCTDTIRKTGYIVVQKAVITFTNLPDRGCIPFTINPVASVVAVDAVTSWKWDFGDGGTSTLQFPSHTYPLQGTYDVRLIITTSSGCTDTLLLPGAVHTGSKPVANFSAVPIPVCGTQPVYFTDLSAPADEWNWNFGDGATSILQNPSHSYSDTGYFDITLIALNNGCPDTIKKINYVRVLPPVARFAITPDCTNRLRFVFTDQSIDPQTWEWNFGDGSPVVTTQNAVHIFPALGPYNVRLIVTHGACADTIVQTVRAVSESPDFTATPLIACKTADITFLATNLNASNVALYTWDFGDGSPAGNGNNPTHTYTISGTYNVTLTITDINGCTNFNTKNNYIRINGPTANFSGTNTSGCAGLTTTFNNLSTTDGVNNIVSWHFNFGDGNSQTYTTPPFSHTYNLPGTYSVQLIVTDASGCKDSITLNNLVTTSDPKPDFYSSSSPSCPGAAVSFVNTSTPLPLTYSWDFGDGGTSTLIAPSHTYAATGLYTIKLFVQDPYGCLDSMIKTNYIDIGKPKADFSVSDSISSCLPFQVDFTNSSAFFNSVLWDFGPGEGTSTVVNPIHFFSVPGTFPVKLVITSPGGCKDSLVRNIYVSDTVGSNVRYLPVSGCKSLPVTFNTFTSGQMATYLWDFGDGYTQTTTTPTINHLYTSFGKFLPKVIMEDPSGCKIPLAGIDTVYVSGASAKFGFDKDLFCDFGTVNFSDSTTNNDPIISRLWKFGDGGTSPLVSPVHNYLTPGLYTVQLIIVTQAGCRDTMTKPNLIRVVQRPLVDIAGDTAVCVNNSLLHSGIFIQPDTSVVTWQWTFPNGNSSALQNPPAQVYTTAGTFVVSTIATNSTGCKDTTTQTIVVHPLPTANLPGQMTIQNGFPVTIPATYSPGTVSWIWSPSAGLSCGNCPTPEASPKFNTTYQVYFSDDAGCSNLASIQVTVICKNANLFVPNTFTPNGDGNNDIFYPRGKGLERVKFMRIFNRWGEVVFERSNFPVNDAASGWNGRFKGQQPKADVYVYQIEVFCDNGETIRLNGNIALVL